MISVIVYGMNDSHGYNLLKLSGLPLQAETWDLPNEKIEKVRLIKEYTGRSARMLERLLPELSVPLLKSSAMPSTEFALTRVRLGRMLNRTEALSEAELISATKALGSVFTAKNRKDYIERGRRVFPPAMLPLLSLYLAEAWKISNEPLAEAMEQVYRLLTAPREGAEPSTSVTVREPTEMPASEPDFLLRQSIGRAINRPGPRSRQGFPLYLFVHLPKTAGTTFLGSVVPQVFQEGEAFVLRGDSVQNRADRHLLNTLTSEKFNQLKFIGGHFADQLINFQGREVQRITLVREPVERCLSSYFHAMYHESTTPKWESFRREKLSFSGFVERYQADNFHSFERMFSPELDAEENCSRVLREFSLVGLTEKFPEFLFLLHSLHGWKLALFENRLVRQEKKDFSLSAEDRAGVQARDDLFWMFRREFELYELATKQFEALWNREVKGNRLVEFETYKSFLGDYQRICAALAPNHTEARKISGQFATWLNDVSCSTPAPLLTELRSL